jgi:hypothetical protein
MYYIPLFLNSTFLLPNMKSLLLLPALFLLLASAAQAQEATPDSADGARAAAYRSGISAAYKAYRDGDYSLSADLYELAFRHVRKPQADDLYNAACAASLAGEVTRAQRLLVGAIERGWEGDAHMNSDPDLEALRAEPKLWEDIHKVFNREMARRYGTEFDGELRAELMRIGEADQAPRIKLGELQQTHGWPPPDSLLKPLLQEMAVSDSINLLRIVQILETKGWPKKKAVGTQAASTVFLVIQHADLATQEKYLPMLEQAVRDGNAQPSSLALLIDRIRMRNNKPQLYGSQLHQDPKTGKTVFYPIEDEANVDERRKAMGLEPLSEYAKRFGITR